MKNPSRALPVLLLLAPLAAVPAVQAQVVSGRVTSGGLEVPFATVAVRGTALGGSADDDGAFRLALPPGTHVVVASAVGFRSAEETVMLGAGESRRLDFALEETVLEGEGVVVTGTLQDVAVSESAVKVEIIPSRVLNSVPTTNLMEVIGNVNGLYQQIDCGVCYTNNIRINGIDGPNTAVLIDGMPIMSSLATVYGLNGISPILIQQVEVVKGPMSTLYGSEALGGVINIITKNPRTAPRLSVNTFGSSDGDLAFEAAAVPTRGRFATLASGSFTYNDAFVDDNRDGFSDLVNLMRVGLFGKGSLSDGEGFPALDVVGKLYYEDRSAGLAAFLDDPGGLRGSSEIYGESIYTRRAELLGTWTLPTAGRALRLQSAYNYHDQDSFYGDSGYEAQQQTAFGQLLWEPTLGARHSLLAGATLRYQSYDDNTGATGTFDDDGALLENRPDDRFVPGVFAQDDYAVSERVRLLGGLRVDYQPEYGVIPSPRLALKLQPAENTTLRLNTGTGFRIVNLFTEDHAAYTGGRATVILEDIAPERSVSGTASLRQIFPLGHHPLTLDLDGFYTVFSNKIEPNYDTEGQIVYRNLDGSATTRGVSLTVQHDLHPFRYTVGATLLDVFVDEGGERRDLEFAPAYQGAATVVWAAPLGFEADYTARLNGPMALPEYEADTRAAYEAATGEPLLETSPAYTVHNLQLRRHFHVGGQDVELVAAVQNLFDYRQSSPLVGFYEGNPGFGETFDTAYVYGPIRGRSFTLGLRLTLPR